LVRLVLASFSVCTDDEASTEKTLLLLKVDDANAFKEWEKTLSKVMASLHATNPQDLRLFPKIKK